MLFKDYISNEVFQDAEIYANSSLSKFILDMFIGNDCNLKCKHCYFGNTHKLDSELSIEEWFGIIDGFCSYDCKHFHISGRESLLSNKTSQIMNYLGELKQQHDIYYGIISNGTSLSIYEYNKILDTNIDYMEFSVDGISESHNLLRGDGSFERLYKTINGLTNKAKISIAFSLHQENIDDFINMVLLFSNIGVTKFYCSPIQNIGSAKNNKLLLIKPEEYVALIDRTIELLLTTEVEGRNVKFCLPSDYVMYLLENNIYLDKVNRYIEFNDTIMWNMKNNIVEIALQMFKIPYYSQVSITSDGYLLCAAENISSLNTDNEISFTNIDSFFKLRRSSILNNLIK